MTAGRAILLHVLQIIPAREVALRVHVSERSVSYWRAGYRNPSLRARLELELHCQIPAAYWEVPAVKRQGSIGRRV